MKQKTLIIFLIICFCFSCSPWKNYYRLEKIRAVRISGRNIGKLERVTPFSFEFLNASRGDYVIFRNNHFELMPVEELRRNYSRKK